MGNPWNGRGNARSRQFILSAYGKLKHKEAEDRERGNFPFREASESLLH